MTLIFSRGSSGVWVFRGLERLAASGVTVSYGENAFLADDASGCVYDRFFEPSDENQTSQLVFVDLI